MKPEQKSGFNLGDYVEVKERIRLFLEQYPDGRLVTANVSASTEPDGKPRIWVEAAAYRTADDPLPGRGWSWMELPGTTSYTRGSELENTETSAWGRAIASLGIGIGKSIASQQEVDAKAADAAVARQFAPPAFDPGSAFDAGLIGTAEKGTGNADFELRQTPDGHAIVFRLVEGRQKLKVEAFGTLAELIAENRPSIEGQRVTAWGVMREETFTPTAKDGKAVRPVTYSILTLSRLKFGQLDLTEPEPEEGPTPEEEDEMAQIAFPVPA